MIPSNIQNLQPITLGTVFQKNGQAVQINPQNLVPINCLQPIQPLNMLHLQQNPQLSLNININTIPDYSQKTYPLVIEPIPEEEKMEVEHNKLFGLEILLHDNIMASEYFKSLFRFQTFDAVLAEFVQHAKDLEPRIVGLSRKASTAYCILLKLFNLKLRKSQCLAMLDHEKPIVRGLGLLYIRYILKPIKLWEWFEASFDDFEEFQPYSNDTTLTIAEFAVKLITDIKYCSTSLPRIPKQILHIFKREIVRRELLAKRDSANEWMRDELEVGMKVKCLYEEDQEYYQATITKMLDRGDYRVKYDEYDEVATVRIGDLKLIKSKEKKTSRERSRERKRRSRERDRDRKRRRRKSTDREEKDRSRKRRRMDHSVNFDSVDIKITNDVLDSIISEREKKDATAVGKNYAKVVCGLKRSLSLYSEVSTNRDRSPSPIHHRYRYRQRREVALPVEAPRRRKRQLTEEEIRNQQKIRQKYGDASANANAE